MVVILSAFAKIHYKLTLNLYCTPVTCFLRENVGGSEKNRLITGADVRTGDLLPSRMRVAVLSTGQLYLVPFASYSDLLVENRTFFIPHLYLAPPQG